MVGAVTLTETRTKKERLDDEWYETCFHAVADAELPLKPRMGTKKVDGEVH